MDAGRWERVQALFHAAADLPPDQQRSYLESECVDDPSLVGSTLALLDEDSRADSLLDRGLATVAHDLVGRDATYFPTSGRFGPYRIVKLLAERQACVTGDLVDELPLAQSTVSEHLKVLKDAGIVRGAIDGPDRCYCLDPTALRWLEREFAALGQACC